MNYWKITNSAVVEVHSVNSLLAAWGFYGEDSGVNRFVITEPLTTRQLRAIPGSLRDKLDFTNAQGTGRTLKNEPSSGFTKGRCSGTPKRDICSTF